MVKPSEKGTENHRKLKGSDIKCSSDPPVGQCDQARRAQRWQQYARTQRGHSNMRYGPRSSSIQRDSQVSSGYNYREQHDLRILHIPGHDGVAHTSSFFTPLPRKQPLPSDISLLVDTAPTPREQRSISESLYCARVFLSNPSKHQPLSSDATRETYKSCFEREGERVEASKIER